MTATETFTLFHLTYALAKELNIVREGIATGGSTAAIADTTNRTEADDYWNGGTAWIVKDAGGAGAAPEGQFAKVTDFTNTSGSLAFAASSFTAAVAAGDKYAVGKKRYPIDIMIQKINDALAENIKIPQVDTSLTTAADQTEYTLPKVAQRKLLQVFVQTVDDDSDDNAWQKVTNWEVATSDTGTADTLIFRQQYDAGYKIKLVYLAPHPELHVYSDKLNEKIKMQSVVYNATARCLRWYNSKLGGGDQALLDDIAKYESLALKKEQEAPPTVLPKRSPRYLRLQ